MRKHHRPSALPANDAFRHTAKSLRQQEACWLVISEFASFTICPSVLRSAYLPFHFAGGGGDGDPLQRATGSPQGANISSIDASKGACIGRSNPRVSGFLVCSPVLIARSSTLLRQQSHSTTGGTQ